MTSRFYITLLAGAYIAMTGGLCSCNSNAKDELAHHHHDHSHGHEHVHNHDHDHEDGEKKGSGKEIVLAPEIAAQMGVEAHPVKPTTFREVVKVSGKFMESTDGAAVATAPVSGVISFTSGMSVGKAVSNGTAIATVKTTAVSGGDANAAARANMEAAKREVDRLKPLHDHGIVSTAEYNAAVGQYDAAKAAYSPGASSSRVVAPTSGTIVELLVKQGQYVEAGEPIARISSSNMLTLRADLPQRYLGRASTFTGAKVRPSYTDKVFDLADMGAHRLNSGATAADNGYIPIYFSVANNGDFMAGATAEVFLQGASREKVIVVPLTAISEQQGNYFVYVRLDEDCYNKIPVKIGPNDGEFVEIVEGLHAGDNVVTKGAVTVRLAESSGNVPEGHSHNH